MKKPNIADVEEVLQKIKGLDAIEQDIALNELKEKTGLNKTALIKRLEEIKMKKEEPIKKYPLKQKAERGIDYYFSEAKLPKKMLGCGIHNDLLYFGTQAKYSVEDEDGKKYSISPSTVITSDKKFYIGHSSMQDFGIEFQSDIDEGILSYAWATDSINAYLKGDYTLWPLRELYDKIKELNKKHVSHTDPRIHSFVACDIISTYLLPIFDAKGRTFFNAPKGSGKTRQTKIYNLLAFNAVWSSRISVAALYRTTEATSCTHLIDNYDKMPEDKKVEINTLIQTGYQEDAKVNLMGKGNRKSETYRIYTPAVINNILGLDPVTLDRCITIKMLKEKAKQKLKPNPKDPIWGEIRNQLRYYTLDRWKDFRKTFEELNVTEISGRELEISEAVLTVAKVVGDDVYKEVLSWLVRNFELKSKERDLATDRTFLIYQKAYELIGEKEEEKWLRLADLSRELTQAFYGIDQEDDTWDGKQKAAGISISRILNTNPLIGIKERRSGHAGYSEVKLSKKGINRYLETYDYPTLPLKDDTEPQAPQTPTNSNQQPPIPTNTHQQSPNNNINESVLVGVGDSSKRMVIVGDSLGRSGREKKKENESVIEAEYIATPDTPAKPTKKKHIPRSKPKET